MYVVVFNTVPLVLENPVDGQTRVVEAPVAIAAPAHAASFVGVAFRDMFGWQLTSAGAGDVLAKNGVGRGLAVLQGMQGVPWMATKAAGGESGKVTDLEQSIENYLRDCYANAAAREELSLAAFTVLHFGKGDTSSISNIWDLVKTGRNF